MSNYDFFAPAATTMDAPAPMPTPAEGPAKTPAQPRTEFKLRRWHFVTAALVLIAAAAGVVVLLLSGSSKPGRPDPDTARIFGEQARTQLPAPVTTDECMSAMRAFPAIAKDDAASAAFLAGCEG
jgi:hypothetical protein